MRACGRWPRRTRGKSRRAGVANGANQRPPPRRSHITTAPAALRPAPVPRSAALRGDPVAQATLMLRIAFNVAAIPFALDKFANVLTDDWRRYLAHAFKVVHHVDAATAIHIVAVVEILAGLAVA